MVFSVIFEYEDSIPHRCHCYVKASCPEKAKDKVSMFFLNDINGGKPNSTFRIKKCDLTLKTQYLLL